jgi:pimeloyl-ACP methyl ester carboxylesterase
MAALPSAGAARGLTRLLIILIVVLAVPAIGVIALIHAASQPVTDRAKADPSEVLLQTEDATFVSSDGVSLSGWFLRGKRGAPPIVLCHDLGGSRSQLLNAAVALSKSGYPLLLLDFRRHGDSGAARSTLGVNERLDVLAAIGWLRGRQEFAKSPIGGWGVGMGAYALALAALEEPGLTSLALDGLYPDVATEADRRMRAMMPPAAQSLVPAARLLYGPYFRCRLGQYALSKRLSGLSGRNLLLIAASEVPEQFEEERRIYEAIPETAEGDKNLLELRRSGLTGLYAEDRTKYDQAIRDFFATHLAAGSKAGGPIEVIEK